MKVPVKITLGILLAAAALGVAYFAGAHMARPNAPSELSRLIPLDEPDLAASMEDLDYDRLVACIVGMRSNGEEGGLDQFEGSVDTLHWAVINYIAQRLDLTEEEHALMTAEYAASSGTILIDYQQMMGRMNADSIAPAIQPIVTYESYNSVNEFVGIFSGHACGLLSFPGLGQLKRAAGLVKEKEVNGALDVRLTCQNILRGAIAPIAQALREKAVIRDLNTSQLNIETQVRSMVVELATAQDHLSADFTDFYQTKFLFMTSEAVLRARVDATVKVGFDLNKRFSIEMDHDKRSMTIRLPEPEVLSNEVDVEFIDVKNGALVKIDREKYNAALEHARAMMNQQVLGSSIFVTAKHNARRIILTIFQPMMSLPEFRYEVEVLFPRGYRAPVEVAEAVG
jgi:hypothetical protein